MKYTDPEKAKEAVKEQARKAGISVDVIEDHGQFALVAQDVLLPVSSIDEGWLMVANSVK